MSLQGKAYIAGIYEHPLRRADSHSTAQLHAEVALGALEDAGLSLDDVDGYFCGADAPGLGGLTMAEYIGLNKLQHTDTTESGGSAYLLHVSHAAQAIATGRCRVALVTMADRPLAAAAGTALAGVDRNTMPNLPFQAAVPPQPMYGYAMVARRHMHEFGTTPEQLAWVRVAASHHAQHNPHAVHRDVVSVDDVLRSPMVANPLHRLDCCVMTDGGGAVVVVHPDIARQLRRPLVKLIGAGEAVKHPGAGRIDLSYSAARSSGAKAFQDAGIAPADIGYVSLYDSFTITVIVQLEDLGFCPKGAGGRFVADGNLIAGHGALPFNTDGGGLCNNHPGNKGGMTKILEAVRQCRGEAHPAVQVRRREFVLAHGTGGNLAGAHAAGTLIFQAE
ncbi:MAG: thiolase domain-containing protein [Hydrogenophaga sp.]|uniref:thiolase domain-containing protein n=1 Tax=Hydrogenophaga sp. TaxID=1904254 RepID=UPI0027165874|nr:thiolase domain-containing protein [Hydrogenophaga sp.]MDO9481448.1 thiolase domain-containing protein [Hydrogenophaga sp.]MDP3345045.1 thiolase domain-containing protein [Hydrogenophaga sp.]MDP3805676.1 thiolase domain-containing protein [Hydrogenophaga sp.]